MNTRTNHGAIVPIERVEQLKPFTLPTPPPGMKWHREDGWTAEMLPPGKRPFFLGETSVKSNHDNPTDQVGGGKWAWGTLAKGEIATVDCKHLRTARPLLFIHSGHEWTWHRAGDPCPCAEKRIVQVFELNDGSPNLYPAMPEFWDWEGESPDEVKIIGWRYADAEKPDPCAELKKAHAEGKVIQVRGVKHWYDIPEPQWNSPIERYRIKPDDSPPWTEWHGGACPLQDEEVEEWEYKMRSGALVPSHQTSNPTGCTWRHDEDGCDIIAYRVLKWREKKPKVPLGPEDVPPGSVFCVKDRMPGTWHGVLGVYASTVQLDTNRNTYSFYELQQEEWLINRSIPMTGKWDANAWEACEK